MRRQNPLTHPIQGLLGLHSRYGPPDCSAAHRRPLSRGSNPCGYPHEPLVSYRINRQLSGWILPPLVIHAFGAHCHFQTSWSALLLYLQHGRFLLAAGRTAKTVGAHTYDKLMCRPQLNRRRRRYVVSVVSNDTNAAVRWTLQLLIC